MGKKHRNLFGRIVADDNLRLAYRRTAKGKRQTYGYLEFREYDEANLAALQADLIAGTYRPGPFRHFTVTDPKPRQIAALPFRDRLAQHALCAVIEPIFERTFVDQSFACRPGRGTHAGAIRAQALMRRCLARHGQAAILKMDFAGYFRSIDRAILHGLIAKKISCRATLRLIETFTPQTGTGLPIGSLTSQLWANVYATAWDRWLIGRGVTNFVRYMDDTVVIDPDQARLRTLRGEAEAFAAETLHLAFSKWSVAPVSRGVNFLGYRIWPTHKLLRRQSVTRAKRKLRRLRADGDPIALQKFVGSWRGHAQWADTHNLLTSLELAQ